MSTSTEAATPNHLGYKEDIDAYLSSVVGVYEDNRSCLPSNFSEVVRRQQNIGTTTLRFIFWRHIAKNQKSVIPLLEGCDVIAMEGVQAQVYETESENLEMTRLLEEYDEHLSEMMRQPIKGFVKSLRSVLLRRKIASLVDKSDRKIYKHFTGKVEAVASLDVKPIHAGTFRVLEEAYQSKREAMYTLDIPCASWSGIAECILEAAKADAAVMNYRDGLAARQIESLAEKYPGRTIGILYGTSHHTITRLINANVGMQRQFAPDMRKGLDIIGPMLRFDRALTDAFRVSDEYPADALDRCVVWNIALHYSARNRQMINKIMNLDQEEFNVLATKLKLLWGRPVDPVSAEDKEEREFRYDATFNLLRRAAGYSS